MIANIPDADLGDIAATVRGHFTGPRRIELAGNRRGAQYDLCRAGHRGSSAGGGDEGEAMSTWIEPRIVVKWWNPSSWLAWLILWPPRWYVMENRDSAHRTYCHGIYPTKAEAEAAAAEKEAIDMIANVPDAELGDITAHVKTLRTCGRFIRLAGIQHSIEIDKPTARKLLDWLKQAVHD